MATIQTLADDVYVLTNRPDLISETKVAIRKAIRKFHGADTFKRDLAIMRVNMGNLTPVAPNQYRWSIPLDTFPMYRRFKSVNYPMDMVPPLNTPAPLTDWTVGFNGARDYHEIAPDNLLDRYAFERQNYFFITGNDVTLKSGWDIDYLDFTYYKWPVIPVSVTDTLQSWIVNEYPDGIVEEAAGQVFKMIGKDDEFQRFQTLFAENLAIIKATDLGEVA